MNKIAGDTILLKCTRIHNHMMYGSWDTEWDRHIFLSFWAIFWPFTPLMIPKIKILKKWKKCLEILSFYTCVPQMKIIWYMIPEKFGATEQIFYHFGPFFALSPLWRPRKSKFWKIEKNTWRYYHFTYVHHKWLSYDVWFLKYGVWQIFLSFWIVFCTFTPYQLQKIKILEKWKKHLEILSFYTCVT